MRDPAISIPRRFGEIDEFRPGRSGKTLIFIQDAHDSLEAQENIGKLVTHLVEREGVKTVYEEGYEGPVPTDPYFGFIRNPGLKRKVSFFLMDKLRIGGAEYAHINRKKDFRLIGADSLAWHKENLRWFRRMSARRKETERDLETLGSGIRRLEDRFFPRPLKEWIKLKERFTKNELSFAEYLKRLGAFTPSSGDYPAIERVLRASEGPAFVEKLKALRPKQLLEEMEAMENDFAARVLSGEREKELFQYHQSLSLLKRLAELKITREEYGAVRGTLKDFRTEALARFLAKNLKEPVVLSKGWERNLKNALRFYETALERDDAVSVRLEEFLKDPLEKRAALVFGGFHKEKILEIARQKEISCFVVTPRMTEPSLKHQRYYEQLMSGFRYPFERPGNLHLAARPQTFFARALVTGRAEARRQIRELARTLEGKGKKAPRSELRGGGKRAVTREEIKALIAPLAQGVSPKLNFLTSLEKVMELRKITQQEMADYVTPHIKKRRGRAHAGMVSHWFRHKRISGEYALRAARKTLGDFYPGEPDEKLLARMAGNPNWTKEELTQAFPAWKGKRQMRQRAKKTGVPSVVLPLTEIHEILNAVRGIELSPVECFFVSFGLFQWKLEERGVPVTTEVARFVGSPHPGMVTHWLRRESLSRQNARLVAEYFLGTAFPDDTRDELVLRMIAQPDLTSRDLKEIFPVWAGKKTRSELRKAPTPAAARWLTNPDETDWDQVSQSRKRFLVNALLRATRKLPTDLLRLPGPHAYWETPLPALAGINLGRLFQHYDEERKALGYERISTTQYLLHDLGFLYEGRAETEQRLLLAGEIEKDERIRFREISKKIGLAHWLLLFETNQAALFYLLAKQYPEFSRAQEGLLALISEEFLELKNEETRPFFFEDLEKMEQSFQEFQDPELQEIIAGQIRNRIYRTIVERARKQGREGVAKRAIESAIGYFEKQAEGPNFPESARPVYHSVADAYRQLEKADYQGLLEKKDDKGSLLELELFQLEGIDFALKNGNIILGHEMGLGKTPLALAIVQAQKAGRVVIIAPNTLKEEWERQIRIWIGKDERVRVIDGNNRKALHQIEEAKANARFIVINYDKIRDPEIVKALNDWGPDVKIGDEVHHIKEPNALQSGGTQALKKKGVGYLQVRAKRSLNLSGTSIINEVEDLWTVLHDIDPAAFPSLEHFRENFSKDPLSLARLTLLLGKRYFIRRTAEEVLDDVPKKNGVEFIPVRLDPEQQKEYEKELAGYLAKARKNILAAQEKLRQIVLDLGYALKGEREFLHRRPPKLAEAVRIAKLKIDRGEKVTIFSRYNHVIERLKEMLAQELGEEAVSFISSGHTTDERAERVKEFQENAGKKVFLSTYDLGGEGLTLTSANHVIFTDLPYTKAKLEQAIGRVRRKGQEKEVFVYALVAPGTIDDQVVEILRRKETVFDQVINAMLAAQGLEEHLGARRVDRALRQASLAERVREALSFAYGRSLKGDIPGARKYWEELAAAYSESIDRLAAFPIAQALFLYLLRLHDEKMLNLSESKRWLFAPSGPSTDIRALADLWMKNDKIRERFRDAGFDLRELLFTEVDFSPSMLELGKSFLTGKLGLSSRQRVLDLTEGELPREAYDFVDSSELWGFSEEESAVNKKGVNHRTWVTGKLVEAAKVGGYVLFWAHNKGIPAETKQFLENYFGLQLINPEVDGIDSEELPEEIRRRLEKFSFILAKKTKHLEMTPEYLRSLPKGRLKFISGRTAASHLAERGLFEKGEGGAHSTSLTQFLLHGDVRPVRGWRGIMTRETERDAVLLKLTQKLQLFLGKGPDSEGIQEINRIVFEILKQVPTPALIVSLTRMIEYFTKQDPAWDHYHSFLEGIVQKLAGGNGKEKKRKAGKKREKNWEGPRKPKGDGLEGEKEKKRGPREETEEGLSGGLTDDQHLLQLFKENGFQFRVSPDYIPGGLQLDGEEKIFWVDPYLVTDGGLSPKELLQVLNLLTHRYLLAVLKQKPGSPAQEDPDVVDRASLSLVWQRFKLLRKANRDLKILESLDPMNSEDIFWFFINLRSLTEEDIQGVVEGTQPVPEWFRQRSEVRQGHGTGGESANVRLRVNRVVDQIRDALAALREKDPVDLAPLSDPALIGDFFKRHGKKFPGLDQGRLIVQSSGYPVVVEPWDPEEKTERRELAWLVNKEGEDGRSRKDWVINWSEVELPGPPGRYENGGRVSKAHVPYESNRGWTDVPYSRFYKEGALLQRTQGPEKRFLIVPESDQGRKVVRFLVFTLDPEGRRSVRPVAFWEELQGQRIDGKGFYFSHRILTFSGMTIGLGNPDWKHDAVFFSTDLDGRPEKLEIFVPKFVPEETDNPRSEVRDAALPMTERVSQVLERVRTAIHQLQAKPAQPAAAGQPSGDRPGTPEGHLIRKARKELLAVIEDSFGSLEEKKYWKTKLRQKNYGALIQSPFFPSFVRNVSSNYLDSTHEELVKLLEELQKNQESEESMALRQLIQIVLFAWYPDLEEEMDAPKINAGRLSRGIEKERHKESTYRGEELHFSDEKPGEFGLFHPEDFGRRVRIENADPLRFASMLAATGHALGDESARSGLAPGSVQWLKDNFWTQYGNRLEGIRPEDLEVRLRRFRVRKELGRKEEFVTRDEIQVIWLKPEESGPQTPPAGRLEVEIARLGTGFRRGDLQGRWHLDWSHATFPVPKGKYAAGKSLGEGDRVTLSWDDLQKDGILVKDPNYPQQGLHILPLKIGGEEKQIAIFNVDGEGRRIEAKPAAVLKQGESVLTQGGVFGSRWGVNVFDRTVIQHLGPDGIKVEHHSWDYNDTRWMDFKFFFRAHFSKAVPGKKDLLKKFDALEGLLKEAQGLEHLQRIGRSQTLRGRIERILKDARSHLEAGDPFRAARTLWQIGDDAASLKEVEERGGKEILVGIRSLVKNLKEASIKPEWQQAAGRMGRKAVREEEVEKVLRSAYGVGIKEVAKEIENSVVERMELPRGSLWRYGTPSYAGWWNETLSLPGFTIPLLDHSIYYHMPEMVRWLRGLYTEIRKGRSRDLLLNPRFGHLSKADSPRWHRKFGLERWTAFVHNFAMLAQMKKAERKSEPSKARSELRSQEIQASVRQVEEKFHAMIAGLKDGSKRPPARSADSGESPRKAGETAQEETPPEAEPLEVGRLKEKGWSLIQTAIPQAKFVGDVSAPYSYWLELAKKRDSFRLDTPLFYRFIRGVGFGEKRIPFEFLAFLKELGAYPTDPHLSALRELIRGMIFAWYPNLEEEIFALTLNTARIEERIHQQEFQLEEHYHKFGLHDPPYDPEDGPVKFDLLEILEFFADGFLSKIDWLRVASILAAKPFAIEFSNETKDFLKGNFVSQYGDRLGAINPEKLEVRVYNNQRITYPAPGVEFSEEITNNQVWIVLPGLLGEIHLARLGTGFIRGDRQGVWHVDWSRMEFPIQSERRYSPGMALANKPYATLSWKEVGNEGIFVRNPSDEKESLVGFPFKVPGEEVQLAIFSLGPEGKRNNPRPIASLRTGNHFVHGSRGASWNREPRVSISFQNRGPSGIHIEHSRVPDEKQVFFQALFSEGPKSIRAETREAKMRKPIRVSKLIERFSAPARAILDARELEFLDPEQLDELLVLLKRHRDFDLYLYNVQKASLASGRAGELVRLKQVHQRGEVTLEEALRNLDLGRKKVVFHLSRQFVPRLAEIEKWRARALFVNYEQAGVLSWFLYRTELGRRGNDLDEFFVGIDGRWAVSHGLLETFVADLREDLAIAWSA
ncbi:MAG: DEAD/DEAH box helicase [Candidatus Omnitrophica bacterium]|nr:DEAD/DEAH box helicase [Candidatus Omnitrophota bacterium]